MTPLSTNDETLNIIVKASRNESCGRGRLTHVMWSGSNWFAWVIFWGMPSLRSTFLVVTVIISR